MNELRTRIAASFDAQGMMRTLGATLARVQAGEVDIALPFATPLTQQHGYVHAGAIGTILDTACGYAALTVAPPGFEVVTAEFKINLLRPAIGAHFLALGTVRSAGKRLTVCSGEVRAFAEPGAGAFKVVALMQATVANVAP